MPMSPTPTLAISVAGLDPDDWLPPFRLALARSTLPPAWRIEGPEAASGAPGMGDARVVGARVLRLLPPARLGWDEAAKILALVLSALSLSVASVQLGLRLQPGSADPPARPAAQHELVCRIEGPLGSRELRLIGSEAPPEAVLRQCLDETGLPTSIQARPVLAPPAAG